MNDNNNLLVFPAPGEGPEPTDMGRLRYPHTDGYVRHFGDDTEMACTCSEDCVYRYCTGTHCGCEACALRLEVELDEKKARGDPGFLITYEKAVLMFGQNVADEYSADWVRPYADGIPLRALRT